MSIPRYNCDIWLNNHNVQTRIQRQINQTLRCVTKKSYDYPVRTMLRSVGWLNAKNLHDYTKVTRIYSIFRNSASDTCFNLWRKVQERDRAYRTRIRQWQIAWTSRKRGTEKSSFLLSAVNLCNTLGLNSRIFTNSKSMKDYCKSKILEINGNDNL